MTKPLELFKKARSSGQLLRGLYEDAKRSNRKFSLQFICMKADLPSKGYLGDVLSGRRKLNPKYAAKIAAVFGLTPPQKKFFQLLLEIEGAASAPRRKVLEKRLESLRAQLAASHAAFPDDGVSQLLICRVFCSLGIFAEPPTRGKVAGLFDDLSPERFQDVIDQLIRMNLVREENGVLKLVSRELVFSASDPRGAHVKFLEDSIDLAKSKLPEKLPLSEQSYFESSLLSVRRDQFIEALPRIREFFDLTQSELEESSGADAIAFFNIQVFTD